MDRNRKSLAQLRDQHRDQYGDQHDEQYHTDDYD